jgi:ArsR family transcriptional regulator
MDLDTATAALAALAQATRLETFRLLVRHEPDGLPAGEVARQLDIPQNTMSAHLAILTRAGLAGSERHSRLEEAARLLRFFGATAYLRSFGPALSR